MPVEPMVLSVKYLKYAMCLQVLVRGGIFHFGWTVPIPDVQLKAKRSFI